MSVEAFAGYWFGCFGVVALLEEGCSGGGLEGKGIGEDTDWEKVCLGTFYVKPNYPGNFFPIPASGSFLACLFVCWVTYCVRCLLYELN